MREDRDITTIAVRVIPPAPFTRLEWINVDRGSVDMTRLDRVDERRGAVDKPSTEVQEELHPLRAICAELSEVFRG